MRKMILILILIISVFSLFFFLRETSFQIEELNVNESNIDDFLYRNDSAYYDVRMLIDPADFSKIGGSRYLTGVVDGFEVLPYPYLATVQNLPKEVGEGYQGPSLFSIDKKGKYTPNYEESLEILEHYFPKDKHIFLMCGAGGYAGDTEKLLVSQGWDPQLIHNAGGYWYYNGNHKVETYIDGEFCFENFSCYRIDFNKLTEIDK